MSENEPQINFVNSQISEPWGAFPFKPVCQIDWDQKIQSALQDSVEINPFIQHKQPGEEISALEAINWIKGQFGQVDFRPKLFDNVTKSHILCDTGAMLTCIPKEDGDVVDPSTTLKTADGKPMKTYWTKWVKTIGH